MPVFFGGFTIWSLVLLAVGLGLLVAELFQPGFGLLGIGGIGLLILDVLLSATTVGQALLLFSIVLVLALLVLVLGARLLSRGKLPRFLVLQEENHARSSGEPRSLLGQAGTAETVLRPAGIARIGERRVDVVTRGEFLEPGTSLLVTEVDGSRVVVDRAR